MKIKISSFFLFIVLFSCSISHLLKAQNRVIPGDERMIFVKATIKDKHIAVVANQSSMVGSENLVDTLIQLGAHIKLIFCPEHGFRGDVGAGETVRNGRDVRTGIPIVSLYGKKLKPSASDLAGVDLVIYDIQDVGVRYYTYISTLTYVMEACAENFVPLFILDRPDPLGFYVDGPVLNLKFRSFVGMHPIPLVYGMTVGELANMINEEGWLPHHEKCAIGVIPCEHYSHAMRYILHVNPSPNLRNMQAIYLYPSLGLFEGTVVDVGRGTPFPFQVFGNPYLKQMPFTYSKRHTRRIGAKIKHYSVEYHGEDLRGLTSQQLSQLDSLNLTYLIEAYKHYPQKNKFFNRFFENLAGTDVLRKQIESGKTASEIRKSWQPAIQKFRMLRKKYLLYPDSL